MPRLAHAVLTDGRTFTCGEKCYDGDPNVQEACLCRGQCRGKGFAYARLFWEVNQWQAFLNFEWTVFTPIKECFSIGFRMRRTEKDVANVLRSMRVSGRKPPPLIPELKPPCQALLSLQQGFKHLRRNQGQS
jgi:hypothetical protein